jgi:beta-lactamase class A
MDTLHAELTRITTAVRGTVGICAQHIETQHRIAYNADTRFPMASVFKLPVAVYLLTLVDRGLLQLDQLIEVQPGDISPGSGMIQSLLFHPGVQLSLANLLELTLVISDNTASDVLLRMVGGPSAVTQFLHEHELSAIRVDRFTKHLVADKYGLGDFTPPGEWSLERFRTRFEQLTAAELSAAAAAFSADERDSMTPTAMTDLLVKIMTPGLLSARRRSVLQEIMQRCQTGAGAIKKMLPPETPLAHKTGTLAEVVANDIGIVTLPDGAGQLAMAVCVSSPEAQSDQDSICQQVIAHSARAVYDYYRFRSNATHP